jgi:tetratricopeptide (TPR) repeat protein
MPIEIFFSYAHEDEQLRDDLAKHLAALAGVTTSWYDRHISAGAPWAAEIDARLAAADIILLLVSADFLASDYCTNVEVPRALARHATGEARVLPVILRPCHWTDKPYGQLQALPKEAEAVTLWSNRDEAWLDVVNGIRKVIAEMQAGAQTSARDANAPPAPSARPSAPAAYSAVIARIPDFLVVEFVARRDNEGRDIVTRLRTELAPHERRLIVLWGAGGVGKTTLAAESARALLADFNGRVVWTSALGRPDYTRATLLDEIATQLERADLRQLAPAPKAEAVHALLTAAPALVILDNFETMTEAEQKPCADFLHAAPAPALITTRQRIEGERNIPIAAMALEEARDYLRLLVEQTNAAELFAQLDHDRIINTAARNPLLLQWVVAQINGAQDPTAVLDDLTHGTGDAAERVFTRSFELPQVGDDGRAALLALSLFTPDASREALAEVAGVAADVPRLNAAVKQLANLWLIKTADAGRRLALEALTRQLALARLQQDAQADEYRRRFVAHFLRHAEAHVQETPEAYDALEAEKDNLLAAQDVAQAQRDWQSMMRLAAVLADPADGMLSMRGYWDEVLRCGVQAGAAAQAAQDEWQVALFASHVAAMRLERGEYEVARQTYEQVLATFRALKSDAAIAVSLHQLGRIAQEQGEYAEARRLYDESLVIVKMLGDQSGIADTLGQLGRLAEDQGDYGEARRLYDESLKITKKLGDQRVTAITISQLGAVHLKLGELAEAKAKHEESLAIRRRLGEQQGIAVDLSNLGLIAEQEGDRAEAARLLREALSIFERLGLPFAEMARRHLARVEGAGEGKDD